MDKYYQLIPYFCRLRYFYSFKNISVLQREKFLWFAKVFCILLNLVKACRDEIHMSNGAI